LPDSTQIFKADVLYDLALNVGYAALPMDVAKARAYIISLEYKRLNPVALVAKIYYNSVLHIMDDSKRDSAYYVTNKITGQNDLVYMTMDMPGTSSTFGAYVKTVFNLNKKNKLTIQADNYTNHSLAEMTMHMHYEGTPPEEPMYLQTWPDLIRNVTGLFLQETWTPSWRVTLNVSGRLDYNISILQSDLAKEQFSVLNVNLADNYHLLTKNCNVSVRYHPADPLSLMLETGYSERIPTIGEQFGYYLYNAYDGYDYIGYPDIRSEKSEFGRIAVQFTKPWFKMNLSQSLYLVHDYIMGITDVTVPPMNFYTNGTRVYSNVPGAKIYNANLQVQAIPFRYLSLFMLTKYTWGELNSGEPLPLIPPLDNILAISYQRSKWSCSLENETALAQNRINTGYGEITSPAFTLFNIKGSYQFSFPKSVVIDCSLAVTNVFNALYYEHLDWGRIYRPGRSLDILLKVSF
jgi:iron complex outermembrane receptor protein